MALRDFEDGAFPAPGCQSSLPAVTLPMLIDFLADCDILHRPGPTRRTFRWFATVMREGATSTAPGDVGDAHLLFVCRTGYAAELLNDKPAAFALVLVGEDEELPASLVNVTDRFVAVRQSDRFSYFVFLLQSYFMQLLMWGNELDRIALRHGSLSELLDASVPVLKNFIFVTDSSFNVIARTTLVEPPDELHRRIIGTGCLTPQMIAEKRKRLPEKTFYTKEPSELTPHARLSQPIFLNHTYFGSLSMSCCNAPLTDGLRDLYAQLVKRSMPVFERLWRSQVKLNIPHYFFFSKLLGHEEVSDEYVRTQLELASLDERTQFKLVVFEIDEGAEPEQAALVVRAAQPLNQGAVYCFGYQSEVLALLYAPPSDGRLSHRKTLAELEERVYRPFGVASGVSEIFERITDLDLAYRQAKIALGLKNTIRSEQFAIGQGPDKGVYLFGDALLYYLVDPSDKDERFMRFCFSHTILQKMYAEDRQNGTNYLALFWFYLHNERNATAVAQRLHLHRNTVLYRIGKIQERFDFDLSMQSARDRMLLDFKVFFLTMSHESIEKLLADAQEGDDEERG